MTTKQILGKRRIGWASKIENPKMDIVPTPPELLEECAACGDFSSQDDFVTKLAESAVRSLGRVANVDKVVAAKKICRNCFLGRPGGVEGAAANESGGDSGQGNSLMEDTTREAANMLHLKCIFLEKSYSLVT